MTPIQTNMTQLVRALESGNYQQTTGTLRNRDCFCAMGVACNLFSPNGWSGDEFWLDGEMAEGEEAPEAVLGHFGMSEANAHTIMEMNDNGKSFTEIAEYLRETYL